MKKMSAKSDRASPQKIVSIFVMLLLSYMAFSGCSGEKYNSSKENSGVNQASDTLKWSVRMAESETQFAGLSR